MLDDSDLDLIYRCCKARLLRIARAGVPSDADAEDVLHDAFVRFVERAPRHLSAEEAECYLLRSVTNGLCNWWRATHRWKTHCARLGQSAQKAADAGPEILLAEREELALVVRAVSRLPERQQEAIVLRYFAGLPYDEAAATMQCEVPTVRSLVHHALEKLKADLRDEDTIPRSAEE